MLRTARFSVELSQYVAGHPDDLERLPDRDQYQRVPVAEACRVVTACFRERQWPRLASLYAECVSSLPACIPARRVLELVLVALGRGDPDEEPPYARLVLLRREPAAKRRKVVQGRLAPIDKPKPKPPAERERIDTWYEVVVVDDAGEPVSGIELDFAVGSASGRVPTSREGKARVEKADVHTGSVRLADVAAVRRVMEPRWASARTGSAPQGRQVSDAVVAEPARRIPIESEEPHTLVLRAPQPGFAIESVTFVGNHRLMVVNTADWTDRGPAHPQPEWRVNGSETRPVSYTKGTTLAADLEVVPKQPGGPVEEGDVTGDARFAEMTLRGQGQVGGDAVVVSTKGAQLPDRVVALSGDIAWSIAGKSSGKRYDPGTSEGHTVYVTLGTPESVPGSRELGITEKRMAAAVKHVSAARTNDPHGVVSHLMGLVRGYTLRPNPAVPAQYDHPTYFNEVGGAWPIADYYAKSAECQAIVRFVRAAIKQVGCPGQADLVVVWADPDVAGGAKALEAAVPPGGGLSERNKMVGGKLWYACLVDTYPVEGRIYDVEQLTSNYMGLNNFEACLRFEHAGDRRYYGGGAGVYGSADEVLMAFQALAWVTFGHRAPSGGAGARVEKVVRRYRDASGRIL